MATATNALARHGGDIREAASFGDETTGEFFIRIHLRFLAADSVNEFSVEIEQMAKKLGVRWELHDLSRRPRIMIAVSQYDHCLHDLLHRWKSGALGADVPLVVSNHETTRDVVEWHGIPFHYLPVDEKTKPEQERQFLALFKEHDIDLVVLARYMQILSHDLCVALDGRCINIHHSFLPSFRGAMPYRQAHDRGVKLIGATAHYVTDELDEGPIIEQDVRRVTHATSPAQMTTIGRETESSVLARAVNWHLQHRILMNGSENRRIRLAEATNSDSCGSSFRGCRKTLGASGSGGLLWERLQRLS